MDDPNAFLPNFLADFPAAQPDSLVKTMPSGPCQNDAKVPSCSRGHAAVAAVSGGDQSGGGEVRRQGAKGGVYSLHVAVLLRLLILASPRCRDGARRVFTDQTGIACTKRGARGVDHLALRAWVYPEADNWLQMVYPCLLSQRLQYHQTTGSALGAPWGRQLAQSCSPFQCLHQYQNERL